MSNAPDGSEGESQDGHGVGPQRVGAGSRAPERGSELDAGSEADRGVPAAGEAIHLPGPSIIPIANAAGITLIVIGTTINWLLTIVGAIVFLLTTVRWIRDTRRDVAALPEEHH